MRLEQNQQLKGCEEALLRWFAADCAERLLAWERERGAAPHPSFDELLQSTRRLALGEIEVEQHCALQEGREESRQEYGSVAYIAESAMWSLTWVSPEGSADWLAYYLESYAQQTEIHKARSLRKAGEASRRIECLWQDQHLEYLKTVWSICGERSPWLLREGICPISKEALDLHSPSALVLVEGIPTEQIHLFESDIS